MQRAAETNQTQNKVNAEVAAVAYLGVPAA
jgi:hypothetical protein